MKRLVLQELSHPELEEYKNSIELAIIPTGSHEQHGPNLTFSTDTDRAFEMSKLLGEKLFPRVLVCSPVNYGLSDHHMDFTGTISLKPETMVSILMDIALSLSRHGIKKVLFINAHGGNRPALKIASDRIHFEAGLQTAWIGSGTDLCGDLLAEKEVSKVRGHACEGEVSQSMYLAPWLVKIDKLEKGDIRDTRYQRRKWWGQVPWNFKDLTNNGALGDATKASYEMGKEMTDLILLRIENFVREYFFNEPMDRSFDE